jgi:hypothetical protein
MALLSSRVLLQEIDSHSDMKGYAVVKSLGVAWAHAMRSLGATKPDQFLHDALRQVEATPF